MKDSFNDKADMSFLICTLDGMEMASSSKHWHEEGYYRKSKELEHILTASLGYAYVV